MKNDDTDEKKFFTGFEISGHAGFAEKGEDIVCAAVSVLSINTVNAIESLTSNLISVETREDGYLKIQSVDEFDSYGELLMDAFVLGILNIYDEYSNEDYKNEFINIQFEEV
jgi:hypothetical protein